MNTKLKIKSTLKRLIRPALAVSIITAAAIVGLTDPAAAHGDGNRNGGGHDSAQRGGKGYNQDAPHGNGYGHFSKRSRHFWGHRRGHRYFISYPPRHGYGHVPIPVVTKMLLHKHGYRTVRAVTYYPAQSFRGYGRAYNDGAYVAIAYRPDGAYRIHLNPYSGLVIQAAFIGRL